MSNWIKCSDRLPDTDRKVLVACDQMKSHRKSPGYEIRMATYDSQDFITDEEYRIIDNVTHWQELPALPEEEL